MNVYHFLYSTHNVASFCKKYPKDDYVYFHFSKTTFPPTKVNKQGLKFPEHSSICLNRGKLSKLETGNANRGGPQPEFRTEAAAAKSLQSCLTLCDPIDGSPTGFPVPGILQARTLEWVAISFSNAWKWSRSVVSDPQQPHGLQPSRLLHPRDSPGKSTGVGCHCLLRYILIT